MGWNFRAGPDWSDFVKWFKQRWGSKDSGLFSVFGTAGTMGFHLLSGMLVGIFIGYWLDRWLGTHPWMKAVFFIIGVVAGFKNIYLDAKRLIREQEEKDRAIMGGGAKNDSRPEKN